MFYNYIVYGKYADEIFLCGSFAVEEQANNVCNLFNHTAAKIKELYTEANEAKDLPVNQQDDFEFNFVFERLFAGEKSTIKYINLPEKKAINTIKNCEFFVKKTISVSYILSHNKFGKTASR